MWPPFSPRPATQKQHPKMPSPKSKWLGKRIGSRVEDEVELKFPIIVPGDSSKFITSVEEGPRRILRVCKWTVSRQYVLGVFMVLWTKNEKREEKRKTETKTKRQKIQTKKRPQSRKQNTHPSPFQKHTNIQSLWNIWNLDFQSFTFLLKVYQHVSIFTFLARGAWLVVIWIDEEIEGKKLSVKKKRLKTVKKKKIKKKKKKWGKRLLSGRI